MQRINTSNKDPDLFGVGKPGFQAGNPSSGVKATFNSMLQDNAIQEELAALPEFAGLALDTALTVAGQDNAQNLKALYLVLLRQLMTSTTTAGTAPVFTATISSPVALPLVAGLRFRAKFHAATTAASTLNLNALGAKSIKQYDSTGAKVTAVLAANMLTDVEYDGVDWVVRNPINTDAAYSVELQKQKYSSFTTAGTSPAYTATMTPAPAALAAGLRGRAKFHAAATAASTLDLNALGAKSIKQYDSAGVKVAAALYAGALVDLEFDGTDWVVLDGVWLDKKSFPSSLTANGYKKYPDPNSPTGFFIEQWGVATFQTAAFASNEAGPFGSVATNGVVTTTPEITFPIAFSSIVLSCGAIGGASNEGGEHVFNRSTVSATNVSFRAVRVSGNNSTGVEVGDLFWWAKGY